MGAQGGGKGERLKGRVGVADVGGEEGANDGRRVYPQNMEAKDGGRGGKDLMKGGDVEGSC